MKKKIARLDFIKNFWSAKKLLRELRDWEKIFVKHVSNKVLVSKI